MIDENKTVSGIGDSNSYDHVSNGNLRSECSTSDSNSGKVNSRQDTDSPSLPCIVACGYKHFVSYKSGQTFPAFLVKFSPSSMFWRSKREFLQLCRGTEKNSAKNNFISFPKKIYSKAVARAPWIHPSYLNYSNKNSNIDNYEPTLNDILNKLIDPSSNHDIVSIIQHNNNYQPDLKKSLHILDTFLQKHHALATMEWINFERKEDSPQLIIAPYQNNSFDENFTVNSISSSPQKNRNISCAYGQYFASPENVQLVVQVISEYINKLLNIKKIIICEPSCGDGRLIESFLHCQKVKAIMERDHCTVNKNFNNLPYLIVGYDIDDNAIQQSKQRLSKYMNGDDVTENNIILKHKNVLLQSSPRLIGKNDCNDSILIVFGGPPYTTGPGHGTKIERDLPEQFVHHITSNWNADFIAFIMPKRYENFEWSKIIKPSRPQLIEKENSELNSDKCKFCFYYDFQVIPLPNSFFYENNNADDKVMACDKRKIQQPSILIIWTRKKTSIIRED